MSKKEAIVDTCFFNKLSNEGKNTFDITEYLREHINNKKQYI